MWRKILLAFLLAALACIGGAADAHDSVNVPRVALVIGNADYAGRPLPNAVRDASAMSDTLRRLGFDVISYSNLGSAGMNEAIHEFNRRLAAGGVGLLYFAGHGVQVGQSTLLLPVDTRQSPEAPLTQGIDLSRVLADMPAWRDNKLNLVILDTCLDNPFNPANVSLARAPDRTIVAYATALGSFAADTARHGLYTAALLRAMNRAGRDVEDVLREAAGSVRLTTHGAQLPRVESSRWRSGFRFTSVSAHADDHPAAGVDAVVTVQSRGILPKDSNEQYELAFWESIKDSTYASDYEAYLKAYPNGRFATLAHARIDRLRAAAPKAEAQTERPRSAAPSAPPASSPRPPAEKAVAASTVPPPAQASVAVAKPAGATGKSEIRDCPTCPAMIALPGGAFAMGSISGDMEERPSHRVNVAQPFAIGAYEVTIEQWNACVDAAGCPRIEVEGNGSRTAPMRNISWDDAQAYVKWLAKKTGKAYRLPTEAEWEYAERGGTTTQYWWGNEMRKGYADCKDCGEPWNKDSPLNTGSFAANPFGLFDMNGSVWEWVADCWHGSYKGAPSDGRAWDEAGCPTRVIRGGSWPDGAAYMQSSTRFKYSASVRQSQNGMRVARDMK
jgi:formylglycine-generating enzyme required for sulfatase activity